MKSALLLAILVCLGASTLAQAQSSDSREYDQTPTYGVNDVSRTTRAVKYAHRSGSTKIDFQGTSLMPGASGEAKVESKRGAMEIEVEFDGLDKPTSFGTEYLTYVLWAISPEGRSVNVGEVLVGDNHRSKLDVTTDLQSFALIVTAEPYYAVHRPSNVVIEENAIRADTVGTSEAVDAKYELIDRGGYIPTGYHFDPVVLNSKLPLEFFEARNAVRIAKSAGAEAYAAPSYEKAAEQMKRADELATAKHVDKKELISASREVVQTADDLARDRREAHRCKPPGCRQELRMRQNWPSGNATATGDAAIRSPRKGRSSRTPRPSDNSRMPRRIRIGTARPPPTRIKPPSKLNKDKETRRRNRSETGSRPRTRMSSAIKPCRAAKRFAPSCCNNSTSFSRLGIPHAVSS